MSAIVPGRSFAGSKHKRFSLVSYLVELLVVIGIITAILVGILLRRGLAWKKCGLKIVQCADNLRQIHLAMEAYLNESFSTRASGGDARHQY